MANFELVGIEAVVQGMSAFTRDSNNVNKLLNQINASTSKLASDSSLSWGTVERTSNLAIGAIASGAGIAITALASITAATIKMGASFEANVLRAAVATGATTDEFQQLGDVVLQVAKRSSLSIQDIAEAENTLARSGISLRDIQNGVLKSTVSLAEASGGELGLADASKLVSIGMNAWKLSATQVDDVTASLTAVANSSAVGFGDLFTSLQLVAPAAALLGFSVQDTSAALGLFGNAGIKGTTAGTALKTMFTNLLRPTQDAQDIMTKYNIAAFDAQGKALGLRQVIDELNKAFGDQAVAQGKVTEQERGEALVTLFGTRSVLAAIASTKAGTAAFDEFQQKIASTNPNELAQKLRETLNKQIDILKNNLEALIIQMSGPLVDALTRAATNINYFLQNLNPKIPKAFGDALFTIFSGKDFAALGDELNKAFGPQFGTTLNNLVGIILSVRNAISNSLVPAFLILYKSLTNGISVGTSFNDALSTIAIYVEYAGRVIARTIVILSDYVTQIKASAGTSDIFNTVLKAMVSLPLIGLAITLGKIALSLGLISVNAVALSLIVVGLTTVIKNWDTISATALQTFNQIPLSLKILAGVIATVTAAIAVGLGPTLLILAQQFVVLSAQVVIASARFLIFAAQVIGTAIISIPAFIASLVAASVYMITWSSVLIPRMIASLVTLGINFIAVAASAITSSGAIITAWAAGVVPAIVAATTAIITALAPIALGLAAIALVAFALYEAWINDFLGIQEFTQKAINFVIGKFNELIGFLKTIPFIKDLLDSISTGIAGITAEAQRVAAVGGPALVSLWNNIINGAGASSIALANTSLEISNMLALLSRVPSVESQYEYGPGYGQRPRPAYVPETGPAGYAPITPSFPDTGGGGASKAAVDNTKELAAAFERILAVLPGDVKALSEFLAGLAHIDGSRFQPMVNALLSARTQLEAINASFGRMLILDQQIAQVNADIASATAAQNAIDLSAKRQSIGLIQQQNSLSLEALQIQQQLLPIQQAIAAIDRQIADLQRTNLDVARQLLELQIQALPYQQNIAALDKQIAAAQRENFTNTYDTAVLNRDSLPIRQQIADLETKINRTVDVRSTLLKRQQEILAQQSVDNLTRQLNSTQTQLDAAWKTMNVPQILALEAQKDSLTNSVTSAQDQLTSIQDAQKTQAENEELAQIQLKLQEQDLIDILNSYDDQITVLKNQKDQYDANQAVIIAALNEQKQAQEYLLQPILDQIDAINNTKAAQDLQTQLAINALEAQKQALEDLAAPMLAQLQAIQDQSALLQLQIDIINNLATQQKAQYDTQILDDQSTLASLNQIKVSEQERFNNLVIGFANSIAASGAFTAQEAIEVATRLGYGNSEIANIGQIADAYNITLVQAAENATAAIKQIPTDITVKIHFSVDQLPPLPSYEYGGTIPGPQGQPQLVIAHGGEHFLGVGHAPPPMFTRAAASRASNTSNTTNNYNYEVNATYTQPQPATSVALDLRAVIAMSKR